MKKTLCLLIFCSLPCIALAEPLVSQGWIKQLPPTVPMRAGYFTIDNTGQSDDRLIAASSPNFDKVEMHESRMANGMMTMNRMTAVAVSAGNSVEFKPGGLHLMLMGIKAPLKVGDRIPVTLTFDSGKQTIELEVRK